MLLLTLLKFLADDSVMLRVREGALEAFSFGRGLACWHCSRFLHKMEWLKTEPDHDWATLLWEPAETQ